MNSNDILDKLENENLEIASLRKRVLAFFLDDVLLTVLFVIIFFDSFSNDSTYEEILETSQNLLIYMLFLKFIYQSLFVYLYGASIGKIICKLRIIEVNTLDKPNLSSSIVRSFVRIISELLFYLGFLWALKDNTRRTWQDFASNTVVVDVS